MGEIVIDLKPVIPEILHATLKEYVRDGGLWLTGGFLNGILLSSLDQRPSLRKALKYSNKHIIITEDAIKVPPIDLDFLTLNPICISPLNMVIARTYPNIRHCSYQDSTLSVSVVPFLTSTRRRSTTADNLRVKVSSDLVCVPDDRTIKRIESLQNSGIGLRNIDYLKHNPQFTEATIARLLMQVAIFHLPLDLNLNNPDIRLFLFNTLFGLFCKLKSYATGVIDKPTAEMIKILVSESAADEHPFPDDLQKLLSQVAMYYFIQKDEPQLTPSGFLMEVDDPPVTHRDFYSEWD